MPGDPARPPSGPLRVFALFLTALSGRRVARPSSRRGRRSYTSATSSRGPGFSRERNVAGRGTSSRGRRPWRSRGGVASIASKLAPAHPNLSARIHSHTAFIAARRRSYTSATSSRGPGFSRERNVAGRGTSSRACASFALGRRPWRSTGRDAHGWSHPSSRMPGDPARPPSGPLRVFALFLTALSGRRVARPSSRRGAAPTHQRRHREARALAASATWRAVARHRGLAPASR